MMTPEERVQPVHEALVEEYGERKLEPSGTPVRSLVSAIISQNTNDQNRDRAFKRLRERFPTWEEVRDAPTGEVVEALRPAGLAPTKAPRIQKALRAMTTEEGEVNLDFLAEMPLEEARAWLQDLHGVGPKTAAIVLLFALGRPVFPVDTHVHRVSQRLGLIPRGTSREKAHELLEELVPAEIFYPFHINLIRHGRQICEARNPQCAKCMLQELCRYYSMT